MFFPQALWSSSGWDRGERRGRDHSLAEFENTDLYTYLFLLSFRIFEGLVTVSRSGVTASSLFYLSCSLVTVSLSFRRNHGFLLFSPSTHSLRFFRFFDGALVSFLVPPPRALVVGALFFFLVRRTRSW